MKRLSICLLAAIVAAASAALAQDKPPRDSGGTLMDLSAWHPIKPHEFMLNIVDLPDMDAYAAQRRIRDRRGAWERIRFDAGTSAIFVERFPMRIFAESVTNELQSGEHTRKVAERHWQRNAREGFAVEDRRKIYRFGERAGGLLSTRGTIGGKKCLLGSVGFLSDEHKAAWRTHEVYDVIVHLRDCSGDRTIDAVAEWLEGVRIVEPSYNRIGRK